MNDEKGKLTVSQILKDNNDLTFELAKTSEAITIEDVRKIVIELPGREPGILDRHLAGLYGIDTKVLNQQVKRNSDWFDEDYYFEMTKEEIRVTNCDPKNNNPHKMFNHYGCNAASFLIRTPQALKIRKIIIKVFTEKERQGGVSVGVKDFGQMVKDAVTHRLQRANKLSPYRHRKLQHYISLGLSDREIGCLLGIAKSTIREWRKSILQLEMYGDLEGTTDITLVN